MNLAESIATALDGKRSGVGFRVPCVSHGGKDRNLYIADSTDGKLIATCFSHGCTYKEIMEALEGYGLKPGMELSGQQRQVFIQRKTKRQLRSALQIESHILLQFLNDRAGDIVKAGDINYLKLHPEFMAMPDEPFERELLSAKRTKNLIGQLYGN